MFAAIPTMRRVLLLAAGSQAHGFGDAAARLGVELVLPPEHITGSDDKAIADLVAFGRANAVDGLVCSGDRPSLTAAHVARSLRFPWHPPLASVASRNKLLTRERLRDSDLLVPWFFPTSVTAAPAALANMVSYPCVVKPVTFTGGAGVIRADDAASFVAAFERVRALLASRAASGQADEANDGLLVEGFIEGWEFALEGVMHHGALNAFALFDKPDLLEGPIFDETIWVTPSLAPEPMQWDILDAVSRAAAALGLQHGPVHAEVRVADRGVYVLSVAAKPMEALWSPTLRFQKKDEGRPGGPTVPLEEVLLRHALGESPSDWRREAAASGVMMIPVPARGVLRSVEGVADAAAIPGIDAVRILVTADQLVVPRPDASAQLGVIFAHGATTEEVEGSLREAHALLRFAIDPAA